MILNMTNTTFIYFFHGKADRTSTPRCAQKEKNVVKWGHFILDPSAYTSDCTGELWGREKPQFKLFTTLCKFEGYPVATSRRQQSPKLQMNLLGRKRTFYLTGLSRRDCFALGRPSACIKLI